jgi:osmotically-inducible protein OsmY
VRNLLVADDDLEIAVASALGRDKRTHEVKAHVESFLGTTTLAGQAPNDGARAAAEQVASQVPGYAA